MAPEVVQKQYDEKCDVWSCGVLLYMMLVGSQPFCGHSDEETMVKIELGRYSLSGTEWKHISPDAKELVQKLLQREPNLRPSAEEALRNPWIQRHTQAPFKLTDGVQTCLREMQSLKVGLVISRLGTEPLGPEHFGIHRLPHSKRQGSANRPCRLRRPRR